VRARSVIQSAEVKGSQKVPLALTVRKSVPKLTPDGLRAVFAYAAEVTQDEALHVVRRGVA
jgi:hypothetical protein